MSKVKELVGRLIANAATPFTETDRERLEAWPEEQLVGLDKWVGELESKEAELKAEAEKKETPDPNLVTLTKDEATQMRKALAREQEREKAHRGMLVKALMGAAVKYTEAQLNAKETGDLEQLADTLGLLDNDENVYKPDFSGRGMLAAVRANAETDESDAYAPPDPYGLPAATAAALGYRAAKNVQ